MKRLIILSLLCGFSAGCIRLTPEQRVRVWTEIGEASDKEAFEKRLDELESEGVKDEE